MRLTRLEVHGFKSFADRTQIDLDEGLTVVVGPNGCGKSNVVDAIKWCLGEQRVSALRGDQMLDVIFKGNGARPARNFAEVSMTFDNAEGRLPIEYAEVTVTRRLFRSGESEYLINGQVCRLKDVRGLFLDTGLGVGAYSIMEQGRIDAILSANPVDRRRIFEEASGISRYRSRRRESQLKLEKVEQNLLRLGDVVEELEKQLRSLKNQAGRARSYVEVRDRLRDLRALDYRHRWEELDAGLEEAARAVEEAERREHEARGRLEARRDEGRALQGGIDAVRADAEAAADAFRSVSTSLEAAVARRTAIAERLGEAADRRTLLDRRVEALRADVARRRDEGRDVEARLAALRDELSRCEAAVEAARQARAAAADALAAWRADAEARKAAALGRVGELTDARNARADDASRHAALEAVLDRHETRIAEIERELEEQGSRQLHLFEGARSLDEALEHAARALEERRDEAVRVRAHATELDEELARAREALAGNDSRRQLLAEVLERHEDVSAATRRLLELSPEGVEGLLVERIHAPAALAPAVEAALGPLAEAVVVSRAALVPGLLERLGGEDGGRVRLVARDRLATNGTSADAPGRALLEGLAVDDEPLARAVLGHVRLVDDLDAVLSETGRGLVLVTPEGALRDARGAVHVGDGAEGGGLVARRAEHEALQERVVDDRARVEALAARREELRRRQARLETRVSEAESSQRGLHTERERAREREQQVTERRTVLDRELRTQRVERERARTELDEVGRRLEARVAAERELERLVADDRLAGERAEATRLDLDEALADADAGLSAARLERSTRAEHGAPPRGEPAPHEQRVAEREADIRRAREEAASLDEGRAAMEREQQELDARVTALAEERDARAGEQGRARERVAELAERRDALRADERRLEQDVEAATGALADARMQHQEVAIHRDGLREKVLEELEVDLADPHARARLGADAEVVPAGAGARRTEPDAGGGPAEAAPEPVDWDAVHEEIEQLRRRLARLGHVNLEAIDELAEVEERHAFLTGQRDDLLGARKALVDTIARLDRESRERFLETFEVVRGHFQKIFRRLFRGGHADVTLQPDVDVLDAGIEIVAAPPGKDARSISLLSGGERSLTATGLLFALFRTRPSPLSILDEVDAALDETNIERFCGVLESFLGDSQFLVVTHARRTMSYADRIYGVTMQEHGVSKVLTLTLDEAEQHTHQAVA